MAEVRLNNVFKSFDGKTNAVSNVNIEIKDKEFVVLVGPSGCGKSTILRMIAGLEEISDGEIVIDNKIVNNIIPKDRDVAMVFQNYALYPHMTVFENMAFGLKLRKMKKEKIREEVERAAKILDLQPLLKRKPKALSGGQRQRVAIGRAIVRNPKIFLFDEPLSNLDAKLRVQMRTEISKLHQRLGVTMVYVTHDQVEAMTMGDRIIVLKDGEVQQIDTPLNLYNKPINKFVAGFIGSPSMNFINGEILKNGILQFISHDKKISFPIPDSFSNELQEYIANEIVLGIRPETISISQNDDSNLIKFKTVIDVVEPMGNETFIYFQINDEQVVARIKTEENLKPQDQLILNFNSQQIYFFDLNSKKTLNK